jgi:hypothetical protein
LSIFYKTLCSLKPPNIIKPYLIAELYLKV